MQSSRSAVVQIFARVENHAIRVGLYVVDFTDPCSSFHKRRAVPPLCRRASTTGEGRDASLLLPVPRTERVAHGNGRCIRVLGKSDSGVNEQRPTDLPGSCRFADMDAPARFVSTVRTAGGSTRFAGPLASRRPADWAATPGNLAGTAANPAKPPLDALCGGLLKLATPFDTETTSSHGCFDREQLRTANQVKCLHMEQVAFDALGRGWPQRVRREGLRVVAMVGLGHSAWRWINGARREAKNLSPDGSKRLSPVCALSCSAANQPPDHPQRILGVCVARDAIARIPWPLHAAPRLCCFDAP